MRSARGIGRIDAALILHQRSQGAKSITVIHREKSPRGVDTEKERRGIENSASHIERSRGRSSTRGAWQRLKQLELATKCVHQP
jgi:hypothetical protein